jgi:hypothetical protein
MGTLYKKEKKTMKTKYLWMNIVFIAILLLSSCSSQARVGVLRTESQSVELGGAKSVRVEINFGAGHLELSGGAEKLLEADFNYNVARLKPEVEYTDSILKVQQPEVNGIPALQGIADFRNEWGLRLYDGVPIDLRVDVGAGTGTLQLSGLSLTGLDVSLGAGTYTLDLSGDWARNLDVTIDAGAAFLTVRLPGDVEATGLTKDGEVYTNAAYGVSDVTLQIDLQAGIGTIDLVETEN